MKKLLRGIVEFRNTKLPDYRDTFARLALGQRPDSLFICCSDSRVAPNVFASTDPGDLFVVRNVGNLIPPCGEEGFSQADESEVAAIEFALGTLNVKDIIVCGHSECGAMQALIQGRESIQAPHLKSWLRHGNPALSRLQAESSEPAVKDSGVERRKALAPHNHLSQLNVIQQIENLLTYSIIRERHEKGELRLHGWWFDIARADVYSYEPEDGGFVILDEAESKRIMRRLERELKAQQKMAARRVSLGAIRGQGRPGERPSAEPSSPGA